MGVKVSLSIPASNPKTMIQKETQIDRYQPITSDFIGKKWNYIQK